MPTETLPASLHAIAAEYPSLARLVREWHDFLNETSPGFEIHCRFDGEFLLVDHLAVANAATADALIDALVTFRDDLASRCATHGERRIPIDWSRCRSCPHRGHRG